MNAFDFASRYRRLAGAMLGLTLSSVTAHAELEWPPARNYEEPSFPASLTGLPVYDGFAHVVYTVDADGRVLDLVTVETNHQAFGEAVAAAASSWRFTPASAADGPEALPRRGTMRVDFRRTGTLISMTQRDASAAYFPGNLTLPVARAKLEELDAPLQRTTGNRPPSGDTAVLFIVDAEGRARVPVVLRAPSWASAQAALAAVREWRFLPPTRRGRPVCVEAVQRFAPRDAAVAPR